MNNTDSSSFFPAENFQRKHENISASTRTCLSPSILSDDYKNEEWALLVKQYVSVDNNNRLLLIKNLVPLLRTKFSSEDQMNRNKGKILDIIVDGLSEDEFNVYHTSDHKNDCELKKAQKKVKAKVIYYWMKIFEAVFPMKKASAREEFLLKQLKRERSMMEDLDVSKKSRCEGSDISVSTDASSKSSTTLSNKKDKDKMGMDFWKLYFRSEYPDHYHKDDIDDAIRDLWFSSTPKGVITGIPIHYYLRGSYLYDNLKKVYVRRFSEKVSSPSAGVIVVGNVDEREFDLKNPEDLDEYESICRQEDPPSTDVSVFFSKTLLKLIPHSNWSGAFLKPELRAVPRHLVVKKCNEFGRGSIDDDIEIPDYFTTPESVIEYFFHQATFFQDAIQMAESELVFYDPCCGDGAFGRVVKKLFPNKVMMCERDLYPKQESQEKFDYLNEEQRLPPAEYDLMITNPPFKKKFQFLETAYKIGKPFVLLLPLQTLSVSKGVGLIKIYGITIYMCCHSTKFKNEHGNDVSVNGPMAWFYWDGVKAPDQVIYHKIVSKKVNDEVAKYLDSLDLNDY